MTADQRRAVVVRVAVDEFARGGYQGTSTVVIAARAGVSQPYLLRLFAGKREVFLAAAEHATTRAAEAFTAAAEGLDGAPALRAGERAWRRLLGTGSVFAFQWQLHAAAASDPVVREAAARHWERLWRVVATATGLPGPALAGFFGRVLLLSTVTALRPGPPRPAGAPVTTGRAPSARGTRAAPAPAAAPPRPAGR
ncbi:TetR/AcrR family transcriptional regulator [Kitasatospora sp. NPDC056783]|uniref:TetR/AcrR family transcriptional regulator n=1 Tax=Kitasatospora sp. NPDC056783 TaxID=3345943 RepID=UPI003694FDD9